MAEPQKDNDPGKLTGWRRWLPSFRWKTRTALDAENRPDTPRVGSFDEQKEAGPRMLLVEWIFRF